LQKTLIALLVVLVMAPLFAASHDKKNSRDESKIVDAGSFGIFQAGHRVATETFRIQQSATQSLTTSEIKTEGPQPMVQNSELTMAANGDLMKYQWRESQPEQLESSLDAGDQILTQHIIMSEKKEKDIPYILPSSTSVLDDYFFVHREVLTWRYLATQCPVLTNCKLSKVNIGIIVPRQHTSGLVSMEFTGRDKVILKGVQTELNHFVLHADDVDWSLYFDDAQKMVKVEVPSEQTEAVRD
jgi:hypothetical protein